MDKDRFGRNELIGRVVLGAKSGPTEIRHWNDIGPTLTINLDPNCTLH